MTAFHSQLRRIRRLLRLGRLAGAVLASLGLAGFLWLLFALADLAAAFESPARVTVTGLLLAVSALVLLAALVLADPCDPINARIPWAFEKSSR